MPYATRRPRANEDWYDEPGQCVPDLTVYDDGYDFEDTGLLDAEGNMIVRVRDRIGFI